jgi:hypothetical protein
LLKGGQRYDDFQYPDEYWIYYQMADRFGYTPDEVDNLNPVTADWLLAIAATVEDIKAERMQD